jgi:hypothetical protein
MAADRGRFRTRDETGDKMTTTQTKDLESLEGDLETANDAVRQARQALGAATLSGSGETAAQRQLAKATANAEAIELAVDEQARADAEQRQANAVEVAKDERIGLYTWARDYIPSLDRVTEGKQALEAAEQQVRDAFTNCPRRGLLATRRERHYEPGHGRRDRSIDETSLDIAITRVPVPISSASQPRDFGWSTHRSKELSARFTQLIEAEQSGNAEAVTVTGADERQRRLDARRRPNNVPTSKQTQRTIDRSGSREPAASSVRDVVVQVDRQKAGLPR